MLGIRTARTCLVGLLAGLGLATAGFGQWFEHPPVFALDPAVPVAGRPFAVGVDLAATGYDYWCYLLRYDGEDRPSVDLEQQTLVLLLVDTTPWYTPIPCPGAESAEPVRFAIPGDLLAAGYHDVELRAVAQIEPGPITLMARSGVHAAPDVPTLTQWDGRFRVLVEFTDPTTGGVRPAHASPLSQQSGGFWFYDPRNLEVLVKVLDGRPLNGHIWVFAASLTTLRYTLTVIDTAGGCDELPIAPVHCPNRVYLHRAGQSAEIVDTKAFPVPPPNP